MGTGGGIGMAGVRQKHAVRKGTTMQAIQTKFLGPTNTRGSRIQAWCDRGSVTISADHGSSDTHGDAVKALVAKFIAEDVKKHGTPAADNPWARPMSRGGLPGNGGQVFTFADTTFAAGEMRAVVVTVRDKDEAKRMQDGILLAMRLAKEGRQIAGVSLGILRDRCARAVRVSV